VDSALDRSVDMPLDRFLCNPIFPIAISGLLSRAPTYPQAYAPILCVTSACFLGMPPLAEVVHGQKPSAGGRYGNSHIGIMRRDPGLRGF
jgi:hypothetical protein